MENIHIPATMNSPEIDFRFDQHILTLKGESYPENVAIFYGEVISSLKKYLEQQKHQAIEVNIALAYFNSSSTKVLFNMVGMLNDASLNGNTITINWLHDEEDDTLMEFGNELREDFPTLTVVNRPIESKQ